MPSIKIAVLADAAQAKRELGTVSDRAGKLSGSFAKFRGPAVAALGAIGVGAAGAVQSASDLNETVSKSNQVFGSNAGQIDSWASGAAKNLGLSKQAALESAAGFGDMFSQIGFAGDQAAKMSTDVVGLSADLGSFNNLPTADVSDRIAAAFRGEYDSLQKVIPNINAARVESEAMAATGKETAKELTAQEKATAVLAIVQKDGAKATGDFARTNDQAANSQKIAAATAADLGAQLGQKVLPAYTKALQIGLKFLDFLSKHTTAVAVVVGVVGGLAAVVLAVSAAQKIASTAMAIGRGAVMAYTAVQWLLNAAMTANPIGLVVLAIVALVAIFVIAYKKSETFRNIVNGALKAVLAVAKLVWAAIKVAALAAWRFITGYIKLQIKIVATVIKTVVAVAKAVWTAIKTAASTVWNALKTGFSNAVKAVKDKFSSLRSSAAGIIAKIKSLFSPSALLAAGRQLIQGLIDGIRAKISAAVDMVRNAVQRIKDLLPGSPIKSGPLKSWNNGGAGKRLMGLLASGISAGAPGVQATLSRALKPVTSLSAPALSLSGAGGSRGRGYGTTINVTVETAVGTSPAEVGRELYRMLKAYDRQTGRA